MVRLAAVLLAGLLCASAQQATTYRIGGHVVSGGKPLRGAKVTIFVPDRPEQKVSGITGENGLFLFSGVPAGKYGLSVSYKGSTQQYKQTEEGWTAIAVGSGRDSEHIQFVWEAPATIVVAILDEDGEAISTAQGYLFRKAVVNGLSRIWMMGTSRTDGEGKFHFTHLMSGSYYVAADGRPWYAEWGGAPVKEASPNPALDVAYPLTYYPGTTSPDGARMIQLTAGTRQTVELRLQAVRAAHAHFEGLDEMAGGSPGVSLLQRTVGGGWVHCSVAVGNNELSGVAPGDYVLQTRWSKPPKQELSWQPVRLEENSTINLSQGYRTTVSGRVVLDGDVSNNVEIYLQTGVPTHQPSAQVMHDGTFEIDNLQPGSYSVGVGSDADLYVKAVEVSGGSYSDGHLEVTAGEQADLRIKVARGTSNISGVALKDGKPAEGALVLLLPFDRSANNYVPRYQTDSDGSFTIRSIPPGRYTAVAIEDGRGLEYANPAVMASYLKTGHVIDVPSAKAEKLELTVQARK